MITNIASPGSSWATTAEPTATLRTDTRDVRLSMALIGSAANSGARAIDIDVIAHGQIALEDALARDADRVLICDTDPLLTVVWAEVMFGEAPAWLREAARARRYELTLLCDVDLPWIDDLVRYLPEDRAGFAARCERALRDAGRRYEHVRGAGAARGEA